MEQLEISDTSGTGFDALPIILATFLQLMNALGKAEGLRIGEC